MKKPGMAPKIETFKLSQITPSDYNPRMIEMVAMDGLLASIKRFGCVEPIIVNIRGGKNIIIGGHQRYKVLVKLNGRDHRVPCVTVDLKKADEKALNLTLNNPAVQGEFIAGLAEHIQTISSELSDEKMFLELRMDQLRDGLPGSEEDCIYREEELKPYKKTHVLISFPPHILPRIADQLEAIMKVEEVEYEQCSN